MKILGISSYYHDSAAALLDDGAIVAAAHEERFTRKKHDPAFPRQAVEYCLREAGITLSQVDAVAYYEKPFLKFDRLLETYVASAPAGLGFFVKSFANWIQKNLLLRRELEAELGEIDAKFDPRRIFFSDHHLSHAASAFYPSPFESATVLTLDGVGEWATASIATGRGRELTVHKEMRFPHSLGFFYSALTAFCGFKVNSGEYKLMGLAPYGEPRFAEKIRREMISVTADGAVELHLEYFDFLSARSMFSRRMSDFFGVKPRQPEAPMAPVYFDIAASAQKALELVLLDMIDKIHKEFPNQNLCLAGGVALNCVANSEVLRRGPFKNIWVQPAAGDAGGGLGAALALHHQYYQKPRDVRMDDSMKGAYLGPAYDDEAVGAALRQAGLVYETVSESEMLSKTASVLAQGQSVGWFQGRMEFGPRALGARSILADARHHKMQSRLNLQTKFRESFRPFAPIVLSEDTGVWFDFDRPSPYMLFVAPVRNYVRAPKTGDPMEQLKQVSSPLPAITHIDGSARLQTVQRSTNPKLHSLLGEFKKQTACGVLINTSFNVRGEPIVNTPADAIRCFLGTDLDWLVIGNHMVAKEKNRDKSRADHHKKFALD